MSHMLVQSEYQSMIMNEPKASTSRRGSVISDVTNSRRVAGSASRTALSRDLSSLAELYANTQQRKVQSRNVVYASAINEECCEQVDKEPRFSRFGCLPPEIRSMVYELVMKPDVMADRWMTTYAQPSITRVSRSTRQESLSVLHSKATFPLVCSRRQERSSSAIRQTLHVDTRMFLELSDPAHLSSIRHWRILSMASKQGCVGRGFEGYVQCDIDLMKHSHDIKFRNFKQDPPFRTNRITDTDCQRVCYEADEQMAASLYASSLGRAELVRLAKFMTQPLNSPQAGLTYPADSTII